VGRSRPWRDRDHYTTPAAHLSIGNLNKFQSQADPVIVHVAQIKKDQGSDPNRLKNIMVK
jgi:hypothetical protein